jgi:hypothetical protein
MCIRDRVVESHAETSLLRPDSNLVEMDALDPLVYCAGVREYRGLGPKIADAYSIGRHIADAHARKR